MAEGTGGHMAWWFSGRAEEEGDSMAEARGWRRQESRRQEGGQRRCVGGRGREVRSEVASNGQAGGASQAVEAGGHQQINGDRRQ